MNTRYLSYFLAEVETFAKKNPKQLLKKLETYLMERQNGMVLLTDKVSLSVNHAGMRPKSTSAANTKEINFMGVCELEPEPESEGEVRLI